MSYFLADVDRAEKRLRDAGLIGIRFERPDYRFGLTAYRREPFKVVVVYQPARDDMGQPEIVRTVEDVIAEFK